QVVFEEYVEVGFNYRLTDIQAAIGRCQLARLPQMVARRRELAEIYRVKLGRIDGVTVPADRTDTRTNWQSYCVMLPDGVDQRQVMQAMLDDGIATRRGVMNAHLEPAYSRGEEATGVRFPLPVSEKAQDRGLILPMFDEMTEQDVETVSSSLADALRRQRAH
ncbi:MAG TPA: DegT/DnrJ/EryC1/StrS family aminotransferase, partial [Dongiaceae bacterium]|nr:DegT/DnrJ/EryC1/StrS family aminotransferase [Dongiaceae bacterium]